MNRKTYIPLNYFDMNGIIRQTPELNVNAIATNTYGSTSAVFVLNSETNDKCWHSGPLKTPGATLSITFEEKLLYITNYSIQSPDVPGCSPNGAYPKTWDLYGCQEQNDDINSCRLISSIDTSGLIAKLQVKVYNISKTNQGVYKNYKFVAVGPNYLTDEYALAFQAVEFWGTLCNNQENCYFLSKYETTTDFLIVCGTLFYFFHYIMPFLCI